MLGRKLADVFRAHIPSRYLKDQLSPELSHALKSQRGKVEREGFLS